MLVLNNDFASQLQAKVAKEFIFDAIMNSFDVIS